MDLAYDQHTERARRKDRSSINNGHHLSLAPLTVKLPLDGDDVGDGQPFPPYYNGRSSSYLQGKSAPTTPRLLSRPTTPSAARSRSHHRRRPSAPIASNRPASGTATPRRRGLRPDDGGPLGIGLRDGPDGDWLLRTGALITSEAREFKGQSWLVSRQSSTSLAGMRDNDDSNDEDAAREDNEAREMMASRRGSRRGSSDVDPSTPNGSRFNSRYTSRRQSIAESRSFVATPLHQPDGAYFDDVAPDFVHLDARLEELELDTADEDEAAVRRLVRHGHAGKGSWISNVIGWSLFSVNEDEDDDEDDEDDDEDVEESDEKRSEGSVSPSGRWPARRASNTTGGPLERMPLPAKDQGGWRDAAWLLDVASKVAF
ncbi:hypothetical protein L249_0377 [Ophiocordyceps polyrhachis-furcata BCC 54312]|uniref:Uncharacterized protein n=1 Tax=Ophiocordyceps polyrhachis-furcata BCC 54312 TaxID=1330021 RepID=A0A367LE06_9HYPO|nr:hypothetical protein L249_0377 [Ophiocordyceps polyrhachis-furcata BCC 54312]